MGQYYRPIILKKDYKRLVNPIVASFESWNYGNGSKLMEHSYIGNSLVRAVEEMLSFKYKGYPFVWCGDYADDLKLKKYEGNLYDSAYMLRNKCDINLENEVVERSYLINYTRRQYVELEKYTPGSFKIHPLPLLCCNSNGRGGGDYYGTNMRYVGYWAFNRIGVDNDIPVGFKKLDISFEEIR